MPPKLSVGDRAKQFSKDGMVKSGDVLLCRFCNKRVSWDSSDAVKKHIASKSHVDATSTGKRQKTIFEAVEGAKEAKAAKLDLITSTLEMMVSANIPIEKADHPAFRNWIRQNVVGGGELPGSDTLRRQYLPSLAHTRKQKCIAALKEKKVAVMSDETTDKKGRAIYVVLLSTVEPTEKQERYVAAVTSIDNVNGRSCARAISDALQDMEVDYSQVVAFVSDSAKYMTTCFNGLSILLPNEAIQVQCWAHKINLLGALLKDNLPELNQVVIAVKHVFLNARKKRHSFKQFLEERGSTACLFPIPVPTRWNSWLTSVEWLADNWEILFLFLQSPIAADCNFNSGSSFLKNLKEENLYVLHVQSLFVMSLSALIKPLLVKLETNSEPLAAELYPKLKYLKTRLQVIVGGVFSECVNDKLNQLKSVDKGKVTEAMKNAASHMSLKLDTLIASDTAKKFLEPVADLFNKQSVLTQNVTGEEFKLLFSKVPSLMNVPLDECVHAYIDLKEQLKNENLTVYEVLKSMCSEHKSFVDGALRALWMPVSNVDCERFFSQFSCVLTNRRTNLSLTNLELLSSYAYETNV